MLRNINTFKAPAAQTELEAVNTLLSTIGEAPITTLEGPLPHDVATAVNTFNEVLREIQMEGWHFNTEDNYTLPLTPEGEILLAANLIRVSFTDPDSTDVIKRGGRLYDRANHTYQFGAPLSGTVTFLLPFEEIPETIKWYITVRAARRFQERTVGSSELQKFNAQDEIFARAAARREDSELARSGLPKGEATSFTNGWKVADTLKR